ncbi:MAG: DUF4175 family protein [Chrysiogenetes bacterium]|nr:DUF4175 family protein [Chrysiogenetes bacterium]
MMDWLEKPLRRVRQLVLLQNLSDLALLLSASCALGLLAIGWSGVLWLSLPVWAALLGLTIWGGVSLSRSAEPDVEVAKRIERRFPQLDTSLVNAVSFAPSGPGGAEDLDAAFKAWEVERARNLMGGVEPRRAVGWKQTGRIAAATGIICAVVAISAVISPERFSAALSALVRPGAQLALLLEAIRSGGSGSGRDLLADISVEVQYPAYTGLAPQRIVGGDGTVSAMPGSTVKISARALESIDEASFELFTGENALQMETPTLSLQAEVTGNRVVAARFTADEPGSYRFSLDEDPTRAYAIQIVEDVYPQVTLVEPASELEVRPEDRVDVVYNATDDFGLSYIDLVAEMPSGETRRRLFEPGATETGKEGDYTLDLATLDLSEEDGEITLYIEAADNDTVKGPKISRSGRIILALRSADKIHQALLADQERLMQGMVVWLADALEPFPVSAKTTGEKLGKSYGELSGSATRVIEAFPELMARMREDEYADYNVYIAIEKMYRELGTLRGNLLGWAGKQGLDAEPFTGPVSAVAAPLSDLVKSHEEPLEHDIYFLDQLIYKQRMDDALRSEEDILDAKERLAELLEQYKQTQDPELREKILKEMKKLREQIAKALSKMSQLYREMPDEFINPELRDQTSEENMADLSEKMDRALESGDLDAALEDFESFLSQVDQMMSGMRENFGEFNNSAFMKGMQGVMEAESEAAKLAEEQQRILEKTQKIQEEAQSEADREKMKELVGEVREHLENAASASGSARKIEEERQRFRREAVANPPAGATPQEKMAVQKASQTLDRYRLPTTLEGLERQIDQAQLSLDRTEFESVVADIQRALQRLENVERSMEQADKGAPEKLTKEEPRSDDALTQARSELEKAMAKFMKAQQEQQPKLSEQAQQQLKQLQAEQEQLQQRAEELGEKMEQLSEESPMVSSQPGSTLQQAARSMQQAGERLGQGEPAGAIPGEARAQSQLQQAAEQLGQMRQRMQQAGSGMPSPMPFGMQPMGRTGVNGMQSNPREEVEVPEGDERVPAEFREDIIKSMKEAAPDEYKPLNDEYYRKLIR